MLGVELVGQVDLSDCGTCRDLIFTRFFLFLIFGVSGVKSPWDSKKPVMGDEGATGETDEGAEYTKTDRLGKYRHVKQSVLSCWMAVRGLVAGPGWRKRRIGAGQKNGTARGCRFFVTAIWAQLISTLQ